MLKSIYDEDGSIQKFNTAVGGERTFESILLDGKALLDSKATRDEASAISDRNAFICCRYR